LPTACNRPSTSSESISLILVFTRDGRSISKNVLRKAFAALLKRAQVEDFHFHDFRHNAVTRWVLANIRKNSARSQPGQRPSAMHQSADAEIVRVFAERLGWKNVYAAFKQELRRTGKSANWSKSHREADRFG
jgi:integrase